VMWSKVAWEIIDLRERMNLNLYYPTDTLDKRKSLINVLLDGVDRGDQLGFLAFKTPLNDKAFEFKTPFNNVQEIKDIGGRLDSTNVETSPGVYEWVKFPVRWTSEQIKQILIKEIWYFDKKNSELKCEIIGLCPYREYISNGIIHSEPLFWVYYPDARKYLATVPVYNPNNDAETYSFDDLFVSRKFKSYFIREANVYNNRFIIDYVSDRDAQLESERIKKEIFDYEQDLWEN
jgi:gliding motility associated protien GldN